MKEMMPDTLETNNTREKIVNSLRQRANDSRRKANFSLLLIFFIVLSAISIFYFAGDIVLDQSEGMMGTVPKK